MIRLSVHGRDGEPVLHELPDNALIGKGAGCHLQIRGWFVAREHLRLTRTAAGIRVEDLAGGAYIDGKRLAGSADLAPGQVLEVAGCRLMVFEAQAEPRPAEPGGAPAPDTAEGEGGSVARDTAVREWRGRLHASLLERLDLRRTDITGMSDAELRAESELMLRELLREYREELPDELDQAQLLVEVLNEAVGLGPLESLLADDAVSEIMVNRYDEIFIESHGRLRRHPLSFSSNQAVMAVIERIVAPIGRRIDESCPMVDARLRDGSRVNAVIPPLSLKGPALTIRKFSRKRLGMADLVAYGTLSADMAEFLRVCVLSKRNMVVSGGTGSGKTTLLNVLSNFIPEGERVVTIEDAAELKLDHEHLVALESRPANSEGKGQVAIRDLLRNSLRMRPDRIVIGECRGAEALDMLQAMNTGHEGSLTTLHANTPRDALARLETLVMMAGMDLPLAAIREQIASAVDIIVQQTRFACGARIITHISELTGIEGGRIQMQDIFRFRAAGQPDGRTRGDFLSGELAPAFYGELASSGIPLRLDMFKRPGIPGGF